MEKGALSDLAMVGAQIAVRVTPKASRMRIIRVDGEIRIYVTTVPEGGKATNDAIKMLARALGIPKTRLALLRGAASRDKLFVIKA